MKSYCWNNHKNLSKFKQKYKEFEFVGFRLTRRNKMRDEQIFMEFHFIYSSIWNNILYSILYSTNSSIYI